MEIKVVKIGGNVVDNPALLEGFVRDFAALCGAKILVHGGGVMASSIQKALGQTPKMIEGRRITDEDTLRVVTMVYAGWCNKNVVALLQSAGCNAIGLSGADGNVIKAGDIYPSGVNSPFLRSLLAAGMVPVLCAINHDGAGSLLNTNADTIASSVASALAAEDTVDLVYCFEKNGVLSDKDDDNSVIPVITPRLYASLKASGVVAEGMIPKLDNSFKAISSGVQSVIIKHAANLGNDIQTVLKDE